MNLDSSILIRCVFPSPALPVSITDFPEAKLSIITSSIFVLMCIDFNISISENIRNFAT